MDTCIANHHSHRLYLIRDESNILAGFIETRYFSRGDIRFEITTQMQKGRHCVWWSAFFSSMLPLS